VTTITPFANMEEKMITFNEIPEAVSYLIDKVNDLEELIRTTANTQPDENTWYDLDAVCDYLPGSPAKQTVYGWVFKKKIPYHKKGRKLLFLKSEIDEWLISDNQIDPEPDYCPPILKRKRIPQ
jgi:excisionase family DNA binding protein